MAFMKTGAPEKAGAIIGREDEPASDGRPEAEEERREESREDDVEENPG